MRWRVDQPGLTDIAAVPDGWLVAAEDPATLAKLDHAGVLEGAVSLTGATRPRLASSADGHVIAAWSAATQDGTHAFSIVVDGDGHAIANTIDLGPTTGDLAVTSDGASFFVGGGGRLYRVAADGVTTTATTGMPPGSGPALAWAGSTGWYVSAGIAQRFDASGALVGTAIPLALPVPMHSDAVVGDGDGVRIVFGQPPAASRVHFSIATIAETGIEMMTQKEVGIRETYSHVEAKALGDGKLVVAWDGPYLHLAIVTP